MLSYTSPQIPSAPSNIQKGVPLKDILQINSNAYLARNIALVYPEFDGDGFQDQANDGLDELTLMERGRHIANALHCHLPANYCDALDVLTASLTPESKGDDDYGIGVFFYLPHSTFIAEYGLPVTDHAANDTFAHAMKAQYELTKRFTAEFSIRSFLIAEPERTLAQLHIWLEDENYHIRRLCSEGSRPKLPWGKRIHAFVDDPSHTHKILESLKDDSSLYVRRSVANHLGDIAKDHPEYVLELCESWLSNADKERRWVIRHALRYLDKKDYPGARGLRQKAK